MRSDADWSAATWEGSRRAQVRRALRLSVRERLEGLEELTETSARLALGTLGLSSEAASGSDVPAGPERATKPAASKDP